MHTSGVAVIRPSDFHNDAATADFSQLVPFIASIRVVYKMIFFGEDMIIDRGGLLLEEPSKDSPL